MDSELMSRMLAQIVSGVTKETAVGFKMDDETSAMWDRLTVEVADARAKGLQIDVPGEWPSP